MSRRIEPPRSELGRLRTPLTAGELEVLDFFDRLLPVAREIYIQPHLNGLRPDYVLLHPSAGIAVFEIKDWNPSKRNLVVHREEGEPVLYGEDERGRGFRVKDNPIEKVAQYKQAILDLYCPRLAIQLADVGSVAAVITAGVIMTAGPTDAVSKLLQPFRHHLRHLVPGAEKYYPLAGNDALTRNAIGVVFPDYRRQRSNYMTEQLADDLRSWLIEPDYAKTQREPLQLDAKQRDVVLRPPGKTGYRRVKGPAGSGKSVVAAARAAQLSSEDRDVLVITFNMTLLHYLSDLAVRYPAPGLRVRERVTWCHFHEWCKRACIDAGMMAEYRSLWRLSESEREPASRQAIFERELPGLASRAVEITATTYDAILVDEAQDFHRNWWDVLQKIRRPQGEMLLVADKTQDVYGQGSRWTEERMRGAGFTGKWNELEESYRLPPILIPYLKVFIERFLPTLEANFPRSRQLDLLSSIRWIQVEDTNSLIGAGVEAVLESVCRVEPAMLSITDVTLLVQSNGVGLACLAALTKKGVGVAHTFGETDRQRRRRKRGFYMGDGRLKATTFHSFKGWESRAVVVLVERASSQEDFAAVYSGLTRVKQHYSGSLLTVVCAERALADFGALWPEFLDLRGRTRVITPLAKSLPFREVSP